MLSTAGKLAATIVLTTSMYSFANVASAAPMTGALALKNAAPANVVESVQFRRWGWGVGAGLVAGAIIGGALASPYYYGPGPYYAAPGPYYYGPPPLGAPAAPAYAALRGRRPAYCMQRFGRIREAEPISLRRPASHPKRIRKA